jgi:hypothetical protein
VPRSRLRSLARRDPAPCGALAGGHEGAQLPDGVGDAEEVVPVLSDGGVEEAGCWVPVQWNFPAGTRLPAPVTSITVTVPAIPSGAVAVMVVPVAENVAGAVPKRTPTTAANPVPPLNVLGVPNATVLLLPAATTRTEVAGETGAPARFPACAGAPLAALSPTSPATFATAGRR